MGSITRFLYRYKWYVQRFLMSRGYVLEKVKHTAVAPLNVFDLVIRDHMTRTAGFFFVQVGANNGVRADPLYAYIREFHWEGILVEPVPELFAQLRETYADEPQLRFEQVAIGSEGGLMPFFSVREASGVPDEVQGLGSFRRDIILAHKPGVPNIETLLEEITVPVIPLRALLERHGVGRIDLLQLDTEGYDYEVLKTLDFDTLKPAIIQFEHVHLTSAEWREACNLLASQGYRLAQAGRDTVAYLQHGRGGV